MTPWCSAETYHSTCSRKTSRNTSGADSPSYFAVSSRPPETSAARALEYEMRTEESRTRRPAWNRAEGDPIELPYWRFGGAGIGSVLIPFAAILGDDR